MQTQTPAQIQTRPEIPALTAVEVTPIENRKPSISQRSVATPTHTTPWMCPLSLDVNSLIDLRVSCHAVSFRPFQLDVDSPALGAAQPSGSGAPASGGHNKQMSEFVLQSNAGTGTGTGSGGGTTTNSASPAVGVGGHGQASPRRLPAIANSTTQLPIGHSSSAVSTAGAMVAVGTAQPRRASQDRGHTPQSQSGRPPLNPLAAGNNITPTKPRDLPPLAGSATAKSPVTAPAATSEHKRPDSAHAAPGLDRMATRDRVRTRGERIGDEKEDRSGAAAAAAAALTGGLTIITNSVGPVGWGDEMYRQAIERVLKPYRDKQLKKRRSMQRRDVDHLALNRENFASRSAGNSARGSARNSGIVVPPRGVFSADNNTEPSQK